MTKDNETRLVLLMFSIVLIALAAYFSWMFSVGNNVKCHPDLHTLTTHQLDDIKADAYTAGHIDGRGSVFEEESNGSYINTPLGVPEGYKPNPYPEWRKYAMTITNYTPEYNVTQNGIYLDPSKFEELNK